MSPFLWLVQCVRSFLGLPLTCPAELITAPNNDWEAILSVVGEHYAEAYVVHGLEAANLFQDLPEQVQAALLAGGRETSHQSLRLARALHTVHGILTGAGIDVIALKGPVLALRTTGGLSARPFGDVDTLVHAGDTRSAIATLMESGYQEHKPGTVPVPAGTLRRDCEVELIDPEGNLVELHWKIFPWFWRWDLPEEEIWAHAQRIDFYGTSVGRLGDVHELLSLALHHGGKHRWDRISRIIDFHQLVVRTDIDWAQVWSTAANTGTTRALETGLRVCQTILEMDGQYEGQAMAPNDPRAGALAVTYADSMTNRRQADGLRQSLQYVRLRERLRDGMAYTPRFLGEVFTPTDKEEALLGKRWAKVIGVPVRLVRLIWKYGIGRKRPKNIARGNTNDR
jgi:putative nucleotidyltransferase-like protein